MLQANSIKEQKKVESILNDSVSIVVYENGLHIDDFITFDEMAAIVDYLRTCDKKDDIFEKCWIAYRRKGVKKTSKAQWDKLTNEEKEKVLPHIKAYVSSRDVQFQKDFERYLRDKLFNDVVYNKNQVVYDPQRGETYAPQLGGNLFYDEELKCYMLVGGFYDETISDGYTDDERPNGARFMLNNGRGFVSWNRDTKKWEKENN